MAYKLVFTQDKDRFPVLIAGDALLSSSELRILISLFNHLQAASRDSASLSDLAGAASLPEAQVKAALGTLMARGYVEEHGDQREACHQTKPGEIPGNAPDQENSQSLTGAKEAGNDGIKRAAGGGVLDARIMDYELDLDHLIRAGDANIRDRQLGDRDGAGSMPGGLDDGSDITGWNPLMGEESRSSAMRFMVWLRFVLSPDELDACDRFAIAHKDEWSGWIDRFAAARAAGRDDGLLDDIRRRLTEDKTEQPSAPHQIEGGDNPPRHH